jgi:hypothetical protein
MDSWATEDMARGLYLALDAATDDARQVFLVLYALVEMAIRNTDAEDDVVHGLTSGLLRRVERAGGDRVLFRTSPPPGGPA